MLSLCLLMAGLTGRQTFCHIVDYPAGLTHYSVLCSEMNARGDNVSCELNSPSKRKGNQTRLLLFSWGTADITLIEMAPLASNKAQGTFAQSISIIYMQCMLHTHFVLGISMFSQYGHAFLCDEGKIFFQGSRAKRKASITALFWQQGPLVPSSNHISAPNDVNLLERVPQVTAFHRRPSCARWFTAARLRR